MFLEAHGEDGAGSWSPGESRDLPGSRDFGRQFSVQQVSALSLLEVRKVTRPVAWPAARMTPWPPHTATHLLNWGSVRVERSSWSESTTE